jgi:hypothetical protein
MSETLADSHFHFFRTRLMTKSQSIEHGWIEFAEWKQRMEKAC